MELARPNERELGAIREGSRRYGADLLKIAGGELFVSRGEPKEVSLLSKKGAEILKRIGDVYCAGLSLGELKGGRFNLGLEGAFLIAKLALKKVVVNQKGEQLSLYGRDIFIDSVLKHPKLSRGEDCLIVNRQGEPLAIGVFTGKRVLVKNRRDRGWYLRKGG